MTSSELTGIERELVLQYLMDGNVPVTVLPVDKPGIPGEIPAAAAEVFPVAIRAEQMTVIDQGIILLKNASESINRFAGRKVRVQFYFNKLGLYFISEMKQVSAGLALVIPEKILRVTDVPDDHPSTFSIMLYYEAGCKTGGLHLDCFPERDYRLFETPRWSDIPESEGPKAKSCLERIVSASRAENQSIGNGVHLISVCRYLCHEPEQTAAIEGRARAPNVLFIDYERIVFGAERANMILVPHSEYAFKISFPISSGPVRERSLYVTCAASREYTADDTGRVCMECRYTSLKEEDLRLLYEKTKKELFR
jgi:hypothetical protein